jgi:hypothetical protein
LNDVFCGLPQIRKRLVKWGDGNAIAVPHSAGVVSEQALLDAVRSKSRAVSPPPGERPDEENDWTIIAALPLPAESVEHGFGSRNATVIAAQLKAGSDPAACWIESLEEGWLFLLPSAPGSAWLMSVGAAPEAYLERSRLIAPEIEQLGEPAGMFPSYPRVFWHLCGERWLACGAAAQIRSTLRGRNESCHPRGDSGVGACGRRRPWCEYRQSRGAL